ERIRQPNAILDLHRGLLALRHAHRLGRFGEATSLAPSPDVLGFRREGPEGEQLVVLCNRSDREFPLPAGLLDGGLAWRALAGGADRVAARQASILLGRRVH